MKQRMLVVLLAAICALTASSIAWSQTVQGVITGTITDPTGAVVPNATVTITNVGTNASQTVTTGDDGSYRFPLVPPGAYTIVVKAANFAEVRTSGIVVEASQTIPFSVKLQLAKASEIIEVTSQAPLVQTATSDLGYQVDSKTIQNAALVDRDIFDVLPFMAPSVSPGLDMAPTSGGAREAGTSYMLNGAEDNNNFSAGAININPPLESVEDFSILTNSMGAQYGRGAGALVSANQKSGSNKFHGAVYEQNRNATLNANDFFYNRDYGASVIDHAKSVAAHAIDPTVAIVPLLPKRPKYIKNQFGGAVGGPIRKDKTFFFFAYDRYKLLQGVTAANTFAPTSAGLAFVKANGGPLAQQLLTAYPPVTSDATCPSPNDATTGSANNSNVGCLSFSDPQTTTTDAYYGRVDHNFSNSDRLSFVANVTRFTFVDKFGGTTFGTPLANGGNIPFTNTQNQHNLALIETHTFGPRVANEINLSHNRFSNPQIEGDPSKQTAPNIYIDNQAAGCLNYSFGPGEGGQVVAFTQDRWALQDNLTWSLGRHAIKIGGSANYGILYRNWDLGLPSQYEFAELSSISTGPPPAGNSTCPVGAVITPACDGTLQSDGTIVNAFNSNFAGDYPYFEETSVDPRKAAPNKADAYRHYTTHDYSVFAQDDWKVSAHLTVNLGLRWERFGAPSEDHGIIAQFTNLAGCNVATDRTCIGNAVVGPVSRMWKTRNGDFGPRVGFAWDVKGDGKMAVRGGFGIFYDRIFDNIWSNGAWNPPFYALLDFNAAGCGDAIFYSNPGSIGAGYNPANLPPGVPPPGKRVSVRTMDVNMHDSSGQNFYLGVERQFFGSFLLSAKYQGSMGRHLPMLENYNRTDGQAYNATFANNRPNALYTGFNYRSNSVSSNYNALIVEAQKRMSHGLQFQTGYTFSKLLDVNSELFAGCSTIGAQTAPYYYISNQFPRLNYARGAEDHTHAFKFNVTYELPVFKSEKGFIGHALGGWSLGSFFQLYSGHPVDVRLDLNGVSCRRFAARVDNHGGPRVLDQNLIPYDIAGDYNMDGVCNDHPVFAGSNINNVYRNGSPADGIFIDNNKIGCGFQGMPATIGNVDACNLSFGVAGACVAAVPPAPPIPGCPVDSPGTPNALFTNPAYPTGATPFERFGTLGRNVFHGPRFVDMDFGLHKTFKLTEAMGLRVSVEAQNIFNHPNFDGIDGNLNSGTFGQARLLLGGAGSPTQKSRVMSLSARLSF
ncbi:MAG TPA: TonB-dependent receptor [Candidatus Acidoferrum sp.]|nr:TonB-dependent receptor [Candidatus Acidoferrum sp.]